MTPYTGGFPTYIEKCDAVVANGYEGFSLTGPLKRRWCGALSLAAPPWRRIAGFGAHVGGDGDLDQVERVRGRDLVVGYAAGDVERIPFLDADGLVLEGQRSIQPLSM